MVNIDKPWRYAIQSRPMATDHDYGAGDDLLGTAESAKLIGVSVRTLYRYEDQGRITSVRTPGGHRRYRRSEVEALLSRAGAA